MPLPKASHMVTPESSGGLEYAPIGHCRVTRQRGWDREERRMGYINVINLLYIFKASFSTV